MRIFLRLAQAADARMPSQHYRFCGGTSLPSRASGFGNLFSFLSLPLDAACDVHLAQKNYHKLQASLHPDLAAPLPPSSDIASASATIAAENRQIDASSYANAAYETLKDPFCRCRYLLKYLVVEQNNDNKPLTREQEEAVYFLDDTRENLGGTTTSKYVGGGSKLGDAFLCEMMEYNEAIFAMDEDSSTRSSDEEEKLASIEKRVIELSAEFEASATDAWRKKDTQRFRDIILHWTYVNNLRRHIHQRK